MAMAFKIKKPAGRLALGAAAMVVLAACGSGSQEKTADEASQEAATFSAPPVPMTAVTVEDEIGNLAGTVRAAAVWRHPRLAFNSLIIIATDAGLQTFNIEDLAPVEVVEDRGLTGVSLGYDGIGVAAAGILAAFDADDAQFRFYRIDNAARTLVATPSQMAPPAAVNGFCLGRRSAEEGLALHALGEGELISYRLTVSDAGVSAASTSRRDAPGGLTHCVVDDIDGAVYAASRDGAIYRLQHAGAGERISERLAHADGVQTAGIGLALSGLTVGGDAQYCCGQIALIDARLGNTHIFDRETGAKLGIASADPSFDFAGVSGAIVGALSYGNFGGTLRDGIVLLAPNDAPNSVRTLPWLSIMNAINAPLGEPANPRDLAPRAPEGLAIDIAPIQP